MDFPASDEQAYFSAVEERFIELRGAPLLLSPADWQLARSWHERGIPLPLVERVMEEVFERLRQRGAKPRKRPVSLRYVARAVEQEWEHLEELAAPGEKGEAPAFDPAARLAALAAALPAGLPDRPTWRERITGLAGGVEEVEAVLGRLDQELLETARQSLSDEQRAEALRQAEATLAGLGGRLSAEQAERSRRELVRRLERRSLGLPVLSLFSVHAEPAPEADSEADEGPPADG